MRVTLNHRWIPKDSRPFGRTDGTDVAVYLYEVTKSDTGVIRYFAVGYCGKRNKPDFHYAYRTAKQRAVSIAEFIEGRKKHFELKSKIKQERQQPHTLVVGDILKNSWGYDQTNIDYFQVTRVVGPHTVEIREIGTSSRETGFMQGICSPISGKFIGEPMIKRADKDNSVKIHDWGSWAHKVGPLDVGHWTAYA